MNKSAKLAELRHSLARYGLPSDRPAIPLGNKAVDDVLGGGLRPGALHEVFARGWGGTGFGVLLAMLAAGTRTLFWVRPDYEALEYGGLSPTGLAELGGDPRQLVMVRTQGPAAALSAANDILSCPHVGALLLEVGGDPKCLDLVASRRLVLAAEQNGVTAVMLRAGATPEPSAALTRWQVGCAPSTPKDDDWGNPVFDAALVRHRQGGLGRFLLKWNVEHGCFDPADNFVSSDFGAVAAAPAHRQATAQTRRAL